MSSGGQTSTQTSGLSPELQGVLGNVFGAATNALNLPYQQYPGQRVANLSGVQTGALGGINSLMYGTPAMNQGAGFLSNTIANAGNPSNPYTDLVAQTVTQDATRAYNNATSGINSQFNAPGVWGGSRQQIQQDLADTDLARGLSQGLGNLQYQNYNTAQDRAMQATGQAGNMYSTLMSGLGSGLQAGAVDQGQNQNLLNSLYNEWQTAYQYPWTQLNNFGNLAGSFMGAAPRTQTTTGPGGDPTAQGIGTLILANSLSKGKGG